MTFRNSQEAFNDAIKRGDLSIEKGRDNYAGDYMYMHTENGYDFFKSIIHRNYQKFGPISTEGK